MVLQFPVEAAVKCWIRMEPREVSNSEEEQRPLWKEKKTRGFIAVKAKPYMYFVSLGMLYCFLSHQIPYGLEDFFITFIKKYFKSYLGISQQLFNRFSAFSVAFWIVDCHLSSVFWAFLIIRSFHLSTVFQPFSTVKWVIYLPFLGWFPLFLELFSAIFRDFFKRFFFISRSYFD